MFHKELVLTISATLLRNEAIKTIFSKNLRPPKKLVPALVQTPKAYSCDKGPVELPTEVSTYVLALPSPNFRTTICRCDGGWCAELPSSPELVKAEWEQVPALKLPAPMSEPGYERSQERRN